MSTVRDFSQVFDAYAQFEESALAATMEDESITEGTLNPRRWSCVSGTVWIASHAPCVCLSSSTCFAYVRVGASLNDPSLELRLARFEELMDTREFSEKMAEMIDEEIQAQLLALERATMDFLTEHRNQLEALARAVLKHETLSSEDVEEILRKEDARKIA